MKPQTLLVLIVLISLVLGSGGEALASPPTSTGQAFPVVTDLADGLVLDWQIPFPSMTEQTDGSILVQLPGFDTEQDPGATELPYTSRLIALPPGASPEISIVNEASSDMTLAKPLAVAPATEHTQPDGTVIEDNEAVSSAAPETASQVVELKDLGDLRGVRLASLTIHPVLPQGSSLKIYSQLTVEIKFNSTSLQGTSKPETVQNELAGMVINPQDIAAASKPAAVIPQTVDFQAPTAAIEIASEGIYRITGAGLAGIGFPIASVDPHFLRLTRAGADIPFELEGNGDTIFDPGDSLVFYALPRVSRWAYNDVYFLSASPTSGPLVQSVDAAGGTSAGADWFEKTFEQNTYYAPDCMCAPVPMGRDGDRWVWDQNGIRRDYQPSASRSFTFSLINANSSQTGSITVWLIGNTDIPSINPDHLFQVSVNGANLGTMQWDGKQAREQTFNVPAGKLLADNTLTFTLPGIAGVNIEGAWLDAFSVRYQPNTSNWDGEAYFDGSGGSGKYYQVRLNNVTDLRVYDVTNPVSPLRLKNPGINGAVVTFADNNGRLKPRFAVVAGTKVKAPALIRMATALNTPLTTTKGADFVIITPKEWAGAVSGLVTLRQSQHLATVIEYTQAIYDNYGGGIPQPEAIHAYLQDIYTQWKEPQPSYVLLVGDGSVDPKRYHSNSFPTIIPPYLADFDHFSTEGATDNLFVTFGGPADIIPDMMIGRFPVKSLAELNDVVSKIVQYNETNLPPGSWKDNATIVSAMPDSGGEFITAGTNEATVLECTIPAAKLFYPTPYTTELSVHNTLISRWNSGTGLVVFNGHASIQQWATRDQNSGNFVDFFHYNDIATLSNGNKLPVVLDMTCFTGSYQTPGLETVDEGLVLAQNSGALAAWGSTSMGLTSSHEFLAKGFIAAIVSKTNARLGEAALKGKMLLLEKRPSNSDLLDAFNLLGDPTSILSFNIIRSCNFLPSVFR